MVFFIDNTSESCFKLRPHACNVPQSIYLSSEPATNNRTTTSMEKVGDDQWLSGAVTSTFQIQVHTDASGTIRPRRVNEGTVYTDNCGLGWRFGIGADEQPTGTTFNADGGSIKSYKIQFIFDPHLITTAEYGELSVSIDAGPLIFIGVGAGCISCSLPQRNRSTFDIGTYMLLSNLRSTPTLMIRVGLPAKLSFLPQPQPHWFPVEKALEQSLSGKEFVDVKFYAFRKHGSRGAYEPSAIYANSYLLRGHSDDLDTCERFTTGVGSGLTVLGLFPDGFSESTRVELDYHAPDNLHATYDYESDSDLEGDENHGPSTTMFPKSNEYVFPMLSTRLKGRGICRPSIVPPVVSWNFLSRDEPSRRSSHAITVKTAHSRHKNDELSNNPDDPGSPGVTPELPPDALLADEQSEPQVIPLPLSRSNTPDTVQGFTRTGRVIVIKDIAFRT